jgi:hypothetical protein
MLALGTFLGGWLCAHAQFGLAGFWGLGSDELSLVGFVAALAVPFTIAVLYPLSRLAERVAAKSAVPWLVLAGSVTASLALGLWFYVGFLGRPFSLVAQRDIQFVLCFALVGLGYAFTYRLQPSA